MRYTSACCVLAMLGVSAVPLRAEAVDGVIRVGTGSEAVRTASGVLYSADAGFVGGYRAEYASTVVVHGTGDAELYRRERWGMSGFTVPVQSGTHQVTLHLAELFFREPGRRVFDVRAEGVLKLDDVDIVAEAGANVAYDRSFVVEVHDGSLDLDFTSTANHAKVSALTVRSVTPTSDGSAAGVAGPSRPWKSGAGGTGVADGSFGTWRGRPVDIASTWADDTVASTELWQLAPGGEYADWTGDLDIAVGALGQGETWDAAVQGAYDARWRRSLESLRSKWGGRSGTVFIRFAHEMNGSWYPWRVTAGDTASFIGSWRRYRALQQEIFPESRLVFSVNRESVGSGVDWRSTFPGSNVVDVLSVDYYNHYPYVSTAEQFREAALEYDSFGAPKGLLRHLEFASSVGLPLAISEWSGNADEGDSPAFVQGMYDFVQEHAGEGAGRVLYECLFNVDRDRRNWLLSADTRMPASAEAYRQAW